MLLENTTEEYRADRSRRVPLQRLAKPEEQARMALFLASSESDYVNGSSHLCGWGHFRHVPGDERGGAGWKKVNPDER